MSAVVVPAYLGEVAPAALRGRIVEAYEVMLCLGMLSAMLVDAALQHAPHNWRWMVGAPIAPAIVLASEHACDNVAFGKKGSRGLLQTTHIRVSPLQKQV